MSVATRQRRRTADDVGYLPPALLETVDAASRLHAKGVTPSPANVGVELGINRMVASRRISLLRKRGRWEWGHFQGGRLPDAPPREPDERWLRLPKVKVDVLPWAVAVARHLTDRSERKALVMDHAARRAVRSYVREWKASRRAAGLLEVEHADQ